MLKAPCKDCPDRHPACHSTCEKYLEYYRKNEKMKADRRTTLAREGEYLAVRGRHKGQYRQ